MYTFQRVHTFLELEKTLNIEPSAIVMKRLCVSIHTGDLPHNRDNQANFYALYSGAKAKDGGMGWSGERG